MTFSEQHLLSACKLQIEARFFPELDGEKLKQRDLEYLSELIEEKSGLKISLSTMKRLWRKDHISTPHPSTLNALASLLDFETWQDYKLAEQNVEESIEPAEPKEAHSQKHYISVALISLVVLLLFSLIFSTTSPEKAIDLPDRSFFIDDSVQFSANKTVDVGVPNSVIFHYDLKDTKADSFFIQRSWNPANKTPIDPNLHHLSDIYYSPGFHWSKLIVNDSVIRYNPVHILSEGWLASVKYNRTDPIPIYLDQDDLFNNGWLSVDRENFIKSKIDLDRPIFLRYYNVRKFEGVDSHNFIFETKMKCDSILNVVCPYISLILIAEEDVFYLDLAPKGCVSKLEAKFGETELYGRYSDLSALGTDVYQWQNLEIKTIDKSVEVLLNGKNVLNSSFKKDFGSIVGMIYTFSGPGSVDYVRLKNVKGEEVYGETF